MGSHAAEGTSQDSFGSRLNGSGSNYEDLPAAQDVSVNMSSDYDHAISFSYQHYLAENLAGFRYPNMAGYCKVLPPEYDQYEWQVLTCFEHF